MLLDLPWLEGRIVPNGKCPHYDPSYGEVEICYGGFNWEMNSFFKQIEDLQDALINSGVAPEKTKFLLDTKKYDVPMITILN